MSDNNSSAMGSLTTTTALDKFCKHRINYWMLAGRSRTTGNCDWSLLLHQAQKIRQKRATRKYFGQERDIDDVIYGKYCLSSLVVGSNFWYY